MSSSTANETETKHPPDRIHLRILQINDVYELDNFPHFYSLIQHYRGAVPNDDDDDDEPLVEGIPDEVLVVLAGDFLAPSLLSALDKGRGMVDILMQCGVTHVSLGNHETDIPNDQLARRIGQSSGSFCWLNTNMRELDDKLSVETIPHDIVTITHGPHTKRVGLLGLLTNDPGLYRSSAFGGATIEPIVETTERYMEDVLEPLNLDLVIPLTHQLISQDRDFANKFTERIFPLILGGHDHERYDETHGGSRILKTGYDGIDTGVIDITWDIRHHDAHDDGVCVHAGAESGESSGGTRQIVDAKPKIVAKMIPTNSFPPDASIRARVEVHERVLRELERAKLFKFDDWMSPEQAHHGFSTKHNRLGYSTGSVILTTVLRMGMRAQCAIMNAGGIRGNRHYGVDDENDHDEGGDPDWFTWSDLKAEIPFPTGFVTVRMPGGVLQDTLRHSRRGARQDPPIARGGYLHTCDAIRYDDKTETIVTIRDRPFDPEHSYLVALPFQFFEGVDNHEPLLRWAESQKHVLPTSSEGAKPAKLVIVELFSAMFWLDMGSFRDIDKDGDGVITPEDVRARVTEIFGDDDVTDLVLDSIMDVADMDHSGTISPLEMAVVQFVATDMLDHVCTREELDVMRTVVSEVLGKRPSQWEVKKVVSDLRDVLDLTGDGKITRDEAMKALGEIKRRGLLT